MFTCLPSTSQANQYDLNFLPAFSFDHFMALACEARVTVGAWLGSWSRSFLLVFGCLCSSLCSLVLLPALQFILVYLVTCPFCPLLQ
jgi:hypothetical protein